MPEGEPLSFEARKRNALFALAGVAAVSTLATWVFSNNELGQSLTTILTAVAVIVGILHWCKADAEEREIELSHGLRIFIILMAVFALPYYFIKSRGLKKGLILTGWALLFWILIYFVSAATLLILSLVEDRLGIFGN